MEFVGYIVGTCNGVKINKPLTVTVDDIAAVIDAGDVNITTLTPAHRELVESFFLQVMDAAFTRRYGHLLASAALATSTLLSSAAD